MAPKFWKPTEDEVDEWEQLTQDIKQHALTKRIPPAINKDKVAVNNTTKIDVIHSGASPNYDLQVNSNVGTDYKTAKTIDQGKYSIDAVIDLHGYIADEANILLDRFIIKAVNQRFRLLLIITGKGRVLHSALITWLNNEKIRHFILRVSQASKKHGGSGAFYVFLKRFK